MGILWVEIPDEILDEVKTAWIALKNQGIPRGEREKALERSKLLTNHVGDIVTSLILNEAVRQKKFSERKRLKKLP